MTRIRLALAAALAGVLAGPALAQTAQPAPAVQTPATQAPAETAPVAPADKMAPAAEAQTPTPDTGMKKTQTAHVHHKVHHHVHAKTADTTTSPAATRR